MKLHAAAPSARNAFSGYGADYVIVNGQRITENTIVTPERLLPWSATGFEQLSEADFEVFAAMDLEILLVGTGAKQRFVHPRLTRALVEKRVGVESMDVQAACRTYNILMAEGRRVAAALLFK